MKIQEILETNGNSRVSRVQGNKVTVDHGDGTETTVDTQKNPDALNTDDEGNIELDTEPANSAMQRTKQQQSRPRPGQRVQVKTAQ